jgi:hypothetical protein
MQLERTEQRLALLAIPTGIQLFHVQISSSPHASDSLKPAKVSVHLLPMGLLYSGSMSMIVTGLLSAFE